MEYYSVKAITVTFRASEKITYSNESITAGFVRYAGDHSQAPGCFSPISLHVSLDCWQLLSRMVEVRD